ncbi:MAG: CoB--CoM heterodisulfide reductase iron-sulfur subunit B family protein [Christensenellales bacterium]|jgi:heterodisulfide reductase subunit B
MVFSYYPGCTLKTKAKLLDIYARRSAEALGVQLEELPEWQCCGAVYPMAKDEIASRLSAVRALNDSKEQGRDLVTLCSACHHVIKRVNIDMQSDCDIRAKANAYLEMENEYSGETNVVHYLELLRDTIGFDELKKKVVNPFKGKKIGAYYGCMLLRPNNEMRFDNPENPTIIEDFIRAIGGDPVIYSSRNECCGAYTVLDDAKLAKRLCGGITASAKDKGAQMLVTACPLCKYNLDSADSNGSMPCIYFTELLAEALGVKEGCEAL